MFEYFLIAPISAREAGLTGLVIILFITLILSKIKKHIK